MSKYAGIRTLFVDSGYASPCTRTVAHCRNIQVKVIRHPAGGNAKHWVDAYQLDLFVVLVYPHQICRTSQALGRGTDAREACLCAS